MKNRGITLIEVIVYISLILITFFISSKSYHVILEKQRVKKEIVEITSLFRKKTKRIRNIW
ncbi:pilus assembly FimT family protein [Streptobacillus moniliformis]|uniref:pilus assembly FimT family protein n=1 Tax=Streptobacillus moniliformis TaxID=34105 RepID=UPI0007E4C48A|nr:prepilin-type N-terminal cleavage/methylation domain-containing protein [Streptobacillus moniliformis]